MAESRYLLSQKPILGFGRVSDMFLEVTVNVDLNELELFNSYQSSHRSLVILSNLANWSCLRFKLGLFKTESWLIMTSSTHLYSVWIILWNSLGSKYVELIQAFSSPKPKIYSKNCEAFLACILRCNFGYQHISLILVCSGWIKCG